MAPTTASPVEIFSAEKMYGAAKGKRIFVNICHLLAEYDFRRFNVSSSALFSPFTVFTKIGKKHMIAEEAILDSIPLPSHKISSGAMAMIGVVLSAIAYG